MGKLETYTDAEWSTVASTPQLVGVAMAGAGSSGLFGSTKEMFASARSIIAARKEHASNSLIQAILPDVSNASKAMDDAKKQRDLVMARMKENDIKSSEQLASLILDDCTKAISILEQKESSETVGDYKKWLLSIAEKVANAAKEGDFLGIGGERFSEKEQELYAKLKTNLG